MEEKYKKAMVSNAQLDNEKNNLIYQVDTLKDVIEEQEEQMAEFYRENEEKSKVIAHLVSHLSLGWKIDSILPLKPWQVLERDISGKIGWSEEKVTILVRCLQMESR